MKKKMSKTNNLREDDLQELKMILGVVGSLRFLEQFDNCGSGDYTAEKYQRDEPELSDEEIRALFGIEDDIV